MRGRIVWPIAAMVGVLAAAIVGVVAITPDGSAGRDIAVMLVPILGTLVGGVWLSRVSKRVDDVQAEVTDASRRTLPADPPRRPRVPDQPTSEV